METCEVGTTKETTSFDRALTKPERAWLWRAFGAQQGGAGAAGLVAATLRAR
jgi:hypothetical protein